MAPLILCKMLLVSCELTKQKKSTAGFIQNKKCSACDSEVSHVNQTPLNTHRTPDFCCISDVKLLKSKVTKKCNSSHQTSNYFCVGASMPVLTAAGSYCIQSVQHGAGNWISIWTLCFLSHWNLRLFQGSDTGSGAVFFVCLYKKKMFTGETSGEICSKFIPFGVSTK